MNVLIIGGSGFVSGTLARRARAAGHRVWVVTRGRRPVPDGVTPITADRGDDAAFAAAVRGLEVVAPLAGQVVFVSTDFVYDPHDRPRPQGEEARSYLQAGYGGLKRQAELVYEASPGGSWTILRPCHIYGPGSELGCLPEHSRDPGLLDRIRGGSPLRLVGGGRFLQQPLYAADLVDVILDLAGRAAALGRILNVRGPDTVESRRYYEIIGEVVGAPVRIEDVPVEAFFRENPDKASFLTDRVYSVDRLAAVGARLPATRLADGLREHVAAMGSRQGS